MAEELVLIPKYKYETLVERAEQEISAENTTHPRKVDERCISTEDSESGHENKINIINQKAPIQTGGRPTTMKDEITEQDVSSKPSLYVEKPLSQLNFGAHRVSQNKLKWINYLG